MPTGAQSPQTNGKKKLLVVEDHKDSATTTARLLEFSGHEVRVASTCDAALRIAGEHAFDLYLIDIGLPDGDGCELLQKLLHLCPAPAVALTGYAMPEDVDRGAAAGFTSYLIKPFTLAKLDEAIARAFG